MILYFIADMEIFQLANPFFMFPFSLGGGHSNESIKAASRGGKAVVVEDGHRLVRSIAPHDLSICNAIPTSAPEWHWPSRDRPPNHSSRRSSYTANKGPKARVAA